ncbi:MAG: PAS domain S-box protein [bacterium]|nr:PAS domain S-box protein [bacterium]
MTTVDDQAGLTRVLEKSPHEVYVFDAETLRFRFANEGARRNLEYSIEELRSRTPPDVMPAFSRRAFEDLIAPLRSDASGGITFEAVHRRRSGSEYDVEIHLHPVHLDTEPAFIAHVLDVTKHKRIEGELSMFKQVVEHSITPIVVASLDGRIRHANDAFVRTWGYDDAAQVIGRVNTEFAGSADEIHAIMEALRTEGNWTGESTARRKDGSTFEVYLSASQIPDESGSATCAIATFIDITERKRLRQEFQEAQKMEAIGRLAGGIAHDFNNLLAGIISGCTIARKGLTKSDPSHAILEEVEEDALRGAKVTRQLLDFSRAHKPRPEAVNLCEVVRRTKGLWRRLVSEDIEISTRFSCTACVVIADPAHIEQVLANLVVNAHDAMPRGGKLDIEVSTMVLASPRTFPGGELQPGDYVCLAVSDNGCGMDAETCSKAFEPFFTTKEAGKGTGLGLSSVYGMVTGMGGALDIESEAGAGTTLRVYLPKADQPAEVAEVQAEPTPAAATGSGRILVVEDEPLVRAGIQRILSGLGYEVVAAPQPSVAIESLRDSEQEFDLLLTDIIMPGMDGTELAARALSLRPSLRVVYMSGFSGDALSDLGRVESGFAVMEKPFTEQELAQTVRDALQAP